MHTVCCALGEKDDPRSVARACIVLAMGVNYVCRSTSPLFHAYLLKNPRLCTSALSTQVPILATIPNIKGGWMTGRIEEGEEKAPARPPAPLF